MSHQVTHALENYSTVHACVVCGGMAFRLHACPMMGALSTMPLVTMVVVDNDKAAISNQETMIEQKIMMKKQSSVEFKSRRNGGEVIS